MAEQREALELLAKSIARKQSDLCNLRVVTGFDGFVDEMITLVDERRSLTEFCRVETISRCAELLGAAAGQSSLREIVINRTDPGGCAINMGDGLVKLGVPVKTFATAGEPIHAAFAEYSQEAELHSWGREPGRTLAFEFADGKLMFSAVTQLADFHPAELERRLADGAFFEACSVAHLIAITDWSLYPHMTACWKYLQDTVFSRLTHRPYFLIDLVDPSSRAEADILAMLEVLPEFQHAGPTVLGLNQNEANILSRLLGESPVVVNGKEATVEQAKKLRARLKIHEVVIHAQKYAVLADDDEDSASAFGPYCERPVKSTGAGDRFNAGYALGKILVLDKMQRLLLATAVSGMYVRLGRSATFEELLTFLESWPTH